MRTSSRFLMILLGMLAVSLWLSLLNSPAPNWDEGWTLALARTWVEQGVYAQPLDTGLIAPSLAASFPTVVPVALAFKLLGVGYWQGRMAIALLNVAALVSLALLARSLYGPRVALAVVPVLLLTTIHPMANPFYMGRQTMAETPMLLLLTLAYLALVPALDGSWRWTLLAVLMGGLALVAKAQPTPFWFFALGVAVAWLLWLREWRKAAVIGLLLVGSWGVAHMIVVTWNLLVLDPTLPTQPVVGLTRTVALVLTPTIRQVALVFTLMMAIPSLLGMAWTAQTVWRERTNTQPQHVVRGIILLFLGSWFAWYLLLSVAWGRYLYPVVFLGAMSATALLAEWSGDFHIPTFLQRLRGTTSQRLQAVVVLILLLVTLPLSLGYSLYTIKSATVAPLEATAAWINTQTPPDALIETNESELFLGLQRRYHFPPYQVHVVANQRRFLEEMVPFEYDPLVNPPDYLVTGPMEANWQLYAPLIAAGHFQLVQEFGVYRIYVQVEA
ncbi:ArnT family glycosyltransferase [Candidatus Oscillochloris fontis]|uniref:ArnT family glycosyltransferase n=1 Tax=Candidatus Oscillochloris fontis TaxID=2496868 RepID=UPI00101DE28E|nr:glycosyltransferase family 39 protein [Candidatus Oscillochloris fontis]